MALDKKPQKKDSILNFRKAKSHIEKIISMVEQDRYCMDIMQQNLAVIGLLKSAHLILLENHLRHCFSNAIKSENLSRKEEMIEEILKVTKLANK
ncbi:MAG: metal-sensitive transcriptional regulator [Actinobacteria bacterium]|nr:metal-sensitive transcriptional regulator [Actinomycetota bacterium]